MRKPHFFTHLFPLKGLHSGRAKWQQPEGTSLDLLNVRAYDGLTGRARGGQRPGMAKYVGTQVNSTNRIQDITHVTYASVSSTSATAVAVRAVKAVAVAGGTIKTFDDSSVSSVTTGSGVLSSTAPVVFSTQFFGRIYFVDGTNYVKYIPGTNTASTWAASDGTLPANSSDTARLIESWRGRLVLSGVQSDPQNWFMSAVGDAEDFDYAPADEVETQAVAGNNSPAGMVGDIINGMVPYNDDVLIFGGDHTIWQMTGDPVAGGRLDLISDVTGMAWGRAWCKDPNGVVYFMGSRGGIYRLVPNSRPEKISGDAVNAELQRLTQGTFAVRMAYSDDEMGIYCWMTDLAGNASVHYFFDLRQGGWYRDFYADTSLNPVAVHVLDGDEPADRVLLLGGGDGYIRYLTPQAKSDDGNAIDSYVLFGPIQIIDEAGAALPFVVSELQVVLEQDSSPVSYTVFVGDTPEAVFSETGGGFLALQNGDLILYEDGDLVVMNGEADPDGTLSPVRSAVANPRKRGFAAYVKLGTDSATSQWAMELLQLKVSVAADSKRRRL